MQNDNTQIGSDEAVQKLNKIGDGFLLAIRMVAELNVKLNTDISNDAAEYEMSAPLVRRIRDDLPNQAHDLKDVWATILALKTTIN